MQGKISLFIILLFSILPIFKVNAQQLQGLTINPAIITTSQYAGETKTYNLKIFSDIDRTADVSIKLLDKTTTLNQSVLNDNVAPEFLNLFQAFQERIFIKKEVENSYNLTIKVPDYFLGNYNFAVVFEESSPQVVESQNITETTSQIAIPVILNILKEGEILNEDLNISKYDITPVLTFDGKNTFDISLKNQGVTYLVPRGVLSIKAERILGSYKEQDVSVNTENKIILRDGSLNLNFDNNFEQNSIGEYKATLTVVYGLQNDIVTKEVYFWVFPPWFVAGAVVILLIIIYLIFRTIYKIRKSK